MEKESCANKMVVDRLIQLLKITLGRFAVADLPKVPK
jgi:hypothetical protein